VPNQCLNQHWNSLLLERYFTQIGLTQNETFFLNDLIEGDSVLDFSRGPISHADRPQTSIDLFEVVYETGFPAIDLGYDGHCALPVFVMHVDQLDGLPNNEVCRGRSHIEYYRVGVRDKV
jgi:hypothetical protein